MIHTVKGFGVVNKAEVDVFLEFSSFFHDAMVFRNMKSGVKISIFFTTQTLKWKTAFMKNIDILKQKQNNSNEKEYLEIKAK